MAGRKQTGGTKRKAKAGAERLIEQYEHWDEQRANNPPVGLVTPESDRDSARNERIVAETDRDLSRRSPALARRSEMIR